MGKIIISESERKSILGLYGLISESDDIISQYVSDSSLQNILREIESTLGEKFTKEHFDKEISLSGKIKTDSGRLLPEVISAFNKMKMESGCSDIFIKENISYRSYDDQKNQFLQYATKGISKIDEAMKRASIPGFSQHHTGRAIDYGGNTICLRSNAWPNGDFNKPNKWGFTLPYMSGNIRMQEPWHLYYEGLVKQNNQQQTENGVITVTSLDLGDFGEQIEKQTTGQKLDVSSIKLNMENKTFSINKGSTSVLKLVLRWNMPGETTCISCDNTINKNPEYKPKKLEGGIFRIDGDDNDRIYSLIVLYPKPKINS
jgi:hypothetical protein